MNPVGPTSSSELSARPPTRGPGRDTLSVTAILTLVLWLGVLVIGTVGLAIPYPRPIPTAQSLPPVVVEILEVELTSDPVPLSESLPPPPDLLAPPPLLDPLLPPPDAPPLAAVAEPSPAIAFAMPVEGPVRIVEIASAAQTRAEEPIAVEAAPAPAPAVRAIQYGQGEGRQPAPEYPRQAVREGQEGTVTIRFSVGEEGRVLSAVSQTPSPWPLLNEAALRVVRERWRFRPGALRLYEVAIRFELRK